MQEKLNSLDGKKVVVISQTHVFTVVEVLRSVGEDVFIVGSYSGTHVVFNADMVDDITKVELDTVIRLK